MCITSNRFRLRTVPGNLFLRPPVHLLLSSNKPTCGSSSTCSLAYTYLFTRNFSGKGLFAARVT